MADWQSDERMPNDIEKNIQAMLESLTVSVGPDTDLNSPMHEFDNSGVELNSKELMWLAIGQPLLYGDLGKSAEFPEAKKGVFDTH